MIADSVALPASSSGREVVYDAEHFFDGFKREPRLRAARRCARRREAGADCLVLCDTNGGCLPDEVAAIVADRRRGASSATPARHPRPQRRRAGGRQHAGRGAARARRRCRARSTATASAAATPTSSRSSPTCSSRWASSCMPRRQTWRGCASSRASSPSWPTCEPDDHAAVRRRRAPSPTRAACTSPATAKRHAGLRAHRPGAGRQRAPRLVVSELGGPWRTCCGGPRSSAIELEGVARRASSSQLISSSRRGLPASRAPRPRSSS